MRQFNQVNAFTLSCYFGDMKSINKIAEPAAFFFVGVTDVQTNVESKSVIVQADESVSPQFMLEKLQAVSLIACENVPNL